MVSRLHESSANHCLEDEMNRRYSHVRTIAFVMLAGCGLEESHEPTIVRSIDADETAQLGADARLRLELALGAYRLDASAGPIDVSRIDVVDRGGTVHALAAVIASKVAPSRRHELRGGFLVQDTGAGVDVIFLINNHELSDEPSGTHSTWWRSPKAYCTPNNALIGLGSSQPGNGSILFRGMIPIIGAGQFPTAAETAAQEDFAGTPDNWMMTAFAICGAQLSGLQLVQSSSAINSTSTRSHTVSCPGGTKVVGAGGTIIGANGRVKVDEIRPNDSLSQVTVTASEDQDATGSDWRVVAHAVCASEPAGLVRITATAASAWDGRAVTATCPAEKVLLSAAGGVDATVRTNMRVFSMLPSSNLKSSTVRVTTKGGSGGATGEVRAYAICADG